MFTIWDFNPRSHERSDLVLEKLDELEKFQSTLPREERLVSDIVISVPSNFNPRSHERSDSECAINRSACFISIHAPTRGATIVNCVLVSVKPDFNPRSHERSDFKTLLRIRAKLYFNPRSHERSDRLTKSGTQYQRIFQSTLPREERRYLYHDYYAGRNFNPRSHERSDIAKKLGFAGEAISIHAPTRGATEPLSATPPRSQYFNPRSHERSDDGDQTDEIVYSNFNPRSHERSDGIKWNIWHDGTAFQSTLPREERLISWLYFLWQLIFQSTLPREERPETADQIAKRMMISIHAPTRGATGE